MKFKISKNYYTDCNLYDKSTIEIKDGLTIFVGCNGSGKSTLLRQIKDTLNDSNIPCLFYDYNISGRENAKSNSLFNNQVELFANLLMSSEGEELMQNLISFAGKIGDFVRNNVKEHDELFILLDGIDSGLSIDAMIDIKKFLFNNILKDAKTYNKKIYIIITSNQYEFVKDQECFDVASCKYIKFNTYDEYSDFIIKSRNKKENR